MAKKVLSVLLAVIMALSCFAVAVSALGDPDTATHNASFTVKGAVGSIKWTSNTKFTVNDPVAEGDAEPESTITASQGDVVFVYVYATSDYFIHTVCCDVFYPAQFLDAREAWRASPAAAGKTTEVSAANVKKINAWNTDNALVESYGITTTTVASCWSLTVDSARNDIAKAWPTDDNGKILADFTANGSTPDFSKWHWNRFSLSVNEEAAEGIQLTEDDTYLFRMPITIPENCPDGTYQVLIPEYAYSRTAKPTGFSRITEMGASESGELDGVVDAESVYNSNFQYGDDLYIDFSNAVLTINVGEVAPEGADFTALETLYNSVKDTDVANATDATKAAFNTALSTAASILADKTADQATVDAAKTALENAANGLKYKADYTALDAAIAAADAKNQADYTAASWTPFASSLAAAKAVARDLTADAQGTIDAAANDLAAKTTALVPVTGADYTALNAAIATAEGKTASWYTADSWSAVATALAEAKAVPTDLTSEQQGQIETATNNLNTALAGLEEADADYTALNNALTEANAKVEADYTAASWAAFTTAKNAAAAVPANLKAKDQATVDAAANELVAKTTALVPLSGADYTALDAAIAKAPATEEANYTADSWAAYAAAKTAAENVARDLKETQQGIVDAAEQNLTRAYNALKLKGADYSGVNEAKGLVDTADAETLRLYTVDSLQAFNNAVAAVVEGKTILEQADVDAMEAAIRAAAANLEYKPATTKALDDAIAAANAIDADLVEDMTAVNDAVAAGQALLNKEGLNITDNDAIAAAAKAINDAIAGLKYLGANYTELNAAKAEFEKVVEANYTAASYAAAKSAYDAAVAVPANLGKADQATVDTAANNLKTAIGALEEVDADYTALNAAITAANKIKETSRKSSTENIPNYTAETWAAFADAKAAAAAVPAGLKKSQQATIDDATAALKAAQNALVWAPFDYTDTNALLGDIAALDEMDYTAASWANLMTKKNALVMDYTMENFSKGMSQYTQLNTAKKNLVLAGAADYTAVDTALAAAAALNAEDYTAETWAAVENAVAAVVTGLNVNHQTEVDAMAKAINDAIAALVEAEAPEKDADYTALNAALADAAKVDTDKYTEDTVAALAQAVDAGNRVPADLKESAQATIDNAAKAINDAIAALELKPVAADYTALEAALADAAKVDTDKYTDASVAALADAVAAGNAVPADLTDKDQATIDNAAKAINDAINALQLKPVAAEGSVTGIEYVPASVSAEYKVTVSGRAMMVQFVELDYSNGTRSFDRYHDKVEIQSFKADGTPCSSLDKELAYEVWTITTPLSEGNTAVRVKNNGDSKWENMDLALQFVNQKPVLDSKVISASFAKTEGKEGGVSYTVVTGKDVQAIQFKTEDGRTSSKVAAKATVNADDTLTFKGLVYVYGTGVKTATLRVLDANGWHDANIVLEYNINA
ncbi:MAG: hypothetical protein MJ168_11845 [Clostridia bacterium]|nr:hypothetical protein [Clostridia bacterium]